MKMQKKTIITLVIVAVALILVFSFIGIYIGTYNGMAQGREKVDAARSNIDTVLQRRADLIPNLVSTVKALSSHELEALDKVTAARAAMVGASNTADKLAANEELTTAINALVVSVEAYPEISSAKAYTSLMDELSGTENRIAVARRDYNNAVKTYNNKLITFPNNIIAGMFGFEKEVYYEASAGAETTPNVGDLFG